MPQRDRIVSMLRERGARGVHSFEFYEARMPRAAAVVCDLRKAGYSIESTPETLRGGARGVRYVLTSEPSAGPRPGGPTEPETFFGVEPKPSHNPYEYESEAA